MREISYVDLILPELLWLALLNDSYGLAKGAELGLALPKAVTKIESGSSSPRKWLALTSSYATLTNEQKEQIVSALLSSDELEPLTQALSPLVAFYPECPFTFLYRGQSPRVEDSKTSLVQFKAFLSNLFDKYDKPATLMQANAVYIAFVTDILKVAKGLALSNFPAIADFPETGESKRVAASIYATVSGFGAHFHIEEPSAWPTYFWNRGLELESCKYQQIYQQYE